MRCFVAIELCQDVRRKLADLQSWLGHWDRAVRWVRPESIHLTLKFLGEVPDGQIPAICQVVDEVAAVCDPFALTVQGTGCFPPRGPVRIAWVGVDEPTGRLATCQRLCEDAFAKLGFARETRPFAPHLTLARIKDPRKARDLRDRLGTYVDFNAGTVDAEELVLFESQLSPEGARYVAVHRAGMGSTRVAPDGGV